MIYFDLGSSSFMEMMEKRLLESESQNQKAENSLFFKFQFKKNKVRLIRGEFKRRLMGGEYLKENVQIKKIKFILKQRL